MSNLFKNLLPVESVQDILQRMENRFDSHDFIRAYSANYPNEYASVVNRYHENIGQADGNISAFLVVHANTLHIRLKGEVTSENMEGKNLQCKQWEKL